MSKGRRRRGALALGRARTADLPYEHLGRLEQVDLVAGAIGAAMRDAGIADAEDVHFVQIKCPLLTRERVAEVEARGRTAATRDPAEIDGAVARRIVARHRRRARARSTGRG